MYTRDYNISKDYSLRGLQISSALLIALIKLIASSVLMSIGQQIWFEHATIQQD